MTEFSATITPASGSWTDSNLHALIDALQRGECTEDEFVSEVFAQRESAPTLVWTVLAMVDQRYRLGHLSVDLFRSVKTKIARRELERRDDGSTVELHATVESADAVMQHAAHPELVVTESAAAADGAVEVHLPQDAPVFTAAPAAPKKATLMPITERAAPPPVCEVGGVLLGRFVLQSVLGRGGMGTVFKALDRHRSDLPDKNRHVALKVLDEAMSQRPSVVADLRREFYCTQALAHPNIVKVYEMHHDEGPAFYTMELLEGQLLSNVLERVHPHPLKRPYAWAIIRDVGAALAHAHSRSVVHGDLKPQNIMITDSGELRILDFGASGTSTRQWDTSDSLQRNRYPPVTLAYACCELLDGQETDPRDDLYALACLSYELLAGEHPFQRRRSTVARELGLRPSRPLGLTQSQWRALQLGLSWRRENRPWSVRNWLAMLELEPAPEHLPSFHAADPAKTRYQGWGTGAPAIIVALIAAVGLWAAFRHGPPEPKGVHNPATATTQPAPADSAAMPASPPVTESGEGKLPPPLIPTQSAPATAQQAVQLAAAPSHDQPTPMSATRDSGYPAAKAAAATEISLSADTYRVRADEHFVEINVRRSNESRANSSFAWWTEAASARAGSDFVPQPRTTQLFLQGRHSAKLFVRILPNQSRTHTQTFYVRIDAPSNGYSLGPTTRAAILLPPLMTGANSKPVYSAQRQP
jgi:serine/threonine protein kinase